MRVCTCHGLLRIAPSGRQAARQRAPLPVRHVYLHGRDRWRIQALSAWSFVCADVWRTGMHKRDGRPFVRRAVLPVPCRQRWRDRHMIHSVRAAISRTWSFACASVQAALPRPAHALPCKCHATPRTGYLRESACRPGGARARVGRPASVRQCIPTTRSGDELERESTIAHHEATHASPITNGTSRTMRSTSRVMAINLTSDGDQPPENRGKAQTKLEYNATTLQHSELLRRRIMRQNERGGRGVTTSSSSDTMHHNGHCRRVISTVNRDRCAVARDRLLVRRPEDPGVCQMHDGTWRPKAD
ncbi:hypothetical protein GGX14DRAFT_404841 [Mycena pura]|uniref:Uncharacterized protein n=1 Tax=Mycena pura TaxID=153505 RepID=A0AAD6UTQ3_9AGAR|nr:hypothetical protein GGX14DRAFT_404841 [Mycena pura]